MKELGYSAGYKYSHDFDGHFVEQQYLPDLLKNKIYYLPTTNGSEKDIRERLNNWWKKKPR
jgi:putative ATPase